MLFCSSSQVLELQGREAELKRQEAFYKEQLARIERKVSLSCLWLWPWNPNGVGCGSVWIQRGEKQDSLSWNCQLPGPGCPSPLTYLKNKPYNLNLFNNLHVKYKEDVPFYLITFVKNPFLN